MSIDEILKSNGLSSTKSRKDIFDYLLASPEPVTIQQIISDNPKYDRATTYRTITLFEDLEVAKRVWFGFKYKIELTDKFRKHHHHLVCSKCGQLEEIDDLEFEQKISRLARGYDWQMTDHHLEIIGYCPDCQI